MTHIQNRAGRALNTTPADNAAAQSDENSMAMELSAFEMRGDMVKITHLKANLEARQTAISSLPMTDVQALLSPHMLCMITHVNLRATSTSRSSNRIIRMAAAWRTVQNNGDGHVQLSIIMKHIDLALAENHRVMNLRSDN